ncbi:MAG: EAL domain-containing protein, partial [Methylococcales bacterium]|nr:EAL domain-containing protein [Methylococcales bacterium]
MSSLQLQQELQSIVKHRLLTPHFQPIISLVEKKIIGYEALIRGPSDSCLHNPINLFRVAEEFNLTTQLDFMCREISIEHYAHFNLNTKLLFLNVSPHILRSPKFKPGETLRYLAQFSLSPHDVVIELTEHKPIDDYGLMREAVAHYRDMGFEIALDDLGAGYSSSLRLWSELLPEYIKIDQHFISELQNDTLKFNLICAVQAVANSLHCNVIAEGIETDAEFKAVEELGVTHAQGYFFARPAPVPLVRINTTFFSSNDPVDEKRFWLNAIPVEMISEFVEPISAEMPIAKVLNIFQRHHELTFLPLVDSGIATGIIFREMFLSKLFSSRYGMDLHGRKAIKTFVEQIPLSIDYKTPVELVSQRLTSAAHPEQAFIVTKNGEYIGVATILSLLEAITKQQIDNAKHANPLTLLPGSVPMNE